MRIITSSNMNQALIDKYIREIYAKISPAIDQLVEEYSDKYLSEESIRDEETEVMKLLVQEALYGKLTKKII